ncbi:MAG: alpha/beta hydrolase [Drouetiella hepatica Uher 2000/2452]|jgi:pimeloyl-ACP methyl ester carboxylesterase|uniref:Alpha/beta hydrolase n=1 Tax=Drouetiella hepatica Uher 2000/2452 TaxID=904376 RepID=A0A951QA01_9CYAN|nr:alpha/beta hydrolase [Drouetiella hepatica Uher 2000/2452]
MPYISVRGVDHYYEWITADNSLDRNPLSDKPTLVFIHGWAGSTRYWETTARALTDQFDCLLYDLRGFGRSLLPRPIPAEVEALGYELEGYADDLALLLEALNLKRIYLNAHSTGASIAVLFVNRYPERVEQVILTCSGIFEYEARSFKLFHQASKYVVGFRPGWMTKVPGADRMFMTRFLRRPIPGAARKAFLEDFVAADYEAALGTVYTAVSQRAAEEMPQEFAQLPVPTLLISGEYDQIIPAELGRRAAGLNDRIQQVVMSNTAHFPMLEDTETYLQELRQFLRLPQAIG